MKVKVSYPMTKAIKTALPDYYVSLEKMTQDQYTRYVDIDTWEHLNDYKNGMFKVIRISYPAEYYAVPRYLTSKELTQIYKHSDGSYNGFFEELINEVSI